MSSYIYEPGSPRMASVNYTQTQNITMATDNIVSSEVWTPQQQVQELERRSELVKPDIKFENISFKPNPDDVIVMVPPGCFTSATKFVCKAKSLILRVWIT